MHACFDFQISLDSCTHTLLSTHIFSARCCTHFYIFMRAHPRMAQGREKGLLHAHLVDLYLAFSILMFHPPSLLFLHGHFDTTFPSAQSLPSSTRPKSAGHAHFRTRAQEFGYLADPTHSTGYEPKQRDKTTSVDGDTTPINDPDHDSISDFSKTHSENTGLFGVPTVLKTLCFARVSW